MHHRPRTAAGKLLLLGLLLASGCALNGDRFDFCKDNSCMKLPTQPTPGPAQLQFSEVCAVPCAEPMIAELASPLDLNEQTLSSNNALPMTLQECIQLALSNSKIMRDLGGTVVRSPQSVVSTLDPGLMFSDPRLGEEAALSAFDANFFVNNYFERNDRGLNNQFFGRNGLFKQDLADAGV